MPRRRKQRIRTRLMCLVIIDENGLLAMWIGRVAEVLGRVRRRQPPVPLRSLPCGWIVGTVVASRPACTPATFLRHARHFVAAARTDVRAWATDPSPAQAGKSRRSQCAAIRVDWPVRSFFQASEGVLQFLWRMPVLFSSRFSFVSL